MCKMILKMALIGINLTLTYVKNNPILLCSLWLTKCQFSTHTHNTVVCFAEIS